MKLSSLDVYRDGGSVSASFSAADGEQKTLFFKIDILAQEEGKPRYFMPVIEHHIQVERTSPITGKTHRDWKTETHESSWEQASAILNELKPQVTGFQSAYLWVFDEMLLAARGKGYVTPASPQAK